MPQLAIAAVLAFAAAIAFSTGNYAVAETAEAPEVGDMIGTIEMLDPAFKSLVAPDAQMEIIGEGFEWSEGPVWVGDNNGFVVFSDVLTNTLHRWDRKSGCRVFLTPSGYTNAAARGGETGSNGLALDRHGRLLLCQHGDRRVARLDAPWDRPEPNYVTLADKHDGNRFNSPNDLAVHSSGAIYFTDPPYGLEQNMDDPNKEIAYQGVYRISPDGQVTLATKELERPNGIALSPDEKTLYVANSHPPRPIIMAFAVSEDGTLGEGREFFSARELSETREGSCDGMAVDEHGNLFATGPGGVLVISPVGKHLGTLLTGQRTANCTFGEDGSTLFMTADKYLLQMPTKTKRAGN